MLSLEFFEWMEKEWSWDGELISSLKRFTEKLVAWNKNTYGNIFKQKQRNRPRLEGVVRALEFKTSAGILRLEEKLKKERAELLLQEELLWLQKSRVDRLNFGDQNMNLFHTSRLIHRRRNRIEALKDERVSGSMTERD